MKSRTVPFEMSIRREHIGFRPSNTILEVPATLLAIADEVIE
jgi:hypothetical protein